MPQYVFRKEGPKRDKYTSHACCECHRRKCSGGSTCFNCQVRGIQCTYEETNQRGRKPKKRPQETAINEMNSRDNPPRKKRHTISLKDQLARLQDKVDDLYKNRNLGKGDLPDIQETQNSPESDTQSSSLPATSSPLENTYSMNDFEKFMDNSTVFSHELHTPTLSSRIFENTDTFVAQASSPSSVAISSQIGALQKLTINQRSVKPKHPTQQDHALVHLPDTSTLWLRVDIFFQEFSCYFPFLREEQVRERLSTALNSIGYDDSNNNVPVDAANCKITAILFNMMAYAEAVTESHSLMESRPGSQSYCEGLKLMESMGKLHDNDIETLIYHTLAAATFIAMELLHMALQSVSQGFHIALRIELNNQRRWPENKDDDLACRQSLWWTLYFLDKRITQKIGITYSVRGNECGVREFQNSEKDLGSQAHHELLQSMISFGQLWASIWDDFFSPMASTKEDAWEDMEVTDTKIILAYRRLPSRLHWKSQEVDDYLSNNESEKQIRRRLLVFLRFSCLRLSIRHKSLASTKYDIQRRESCVSLCRAIVEAVQAYTGTFGCHKPSGYILTSALVESLYWVEFERRQTSPVFSQSFLDGIKTATRKLLHDLSLSVSAAARAYESLRDVFFTENLGEFCQVSSQGELANAAGSANNLMAEEMWEIPVEPAGLRQGQDIPPDFKSPWDLSPHRTVQGVENVFSMPLELDWDSLIGSLQPEYPSP